MKKKSLQIAKLCLLIKKWVRKGLKKLSSNWHGGAALSTATTIVLTKMHPTIFLFVKQIAEHWRFWIMLNDTKLLILNESESPLLQHNQETGWRLLLGWYSDWDLGMFLKINCHMYMIWDKTLPKVEN